MPEPPNLNLPPPLPPESEPKRTAASVAPPTSSNLSLDTAAIKAAQKKVTSRTRKTVSGLAKQEKRRFQSDYEMSLNAYDLKWRDLEVKSFEQDITARHSYARRIFILIVSWLLAILLILAFQGWSKLFGGFTLDTKIMLALIGGTTASVLALFTIVAKYLFPETKAQPRQVKSENPLKERLGEKSKLAPRQ